MTTSAQDRLERLLGYLAADPLNGDLLTEAVDAALAANDLDRAETLTAQLRLVLPDAFQGRYFAGLIAMRRGDFTAAADQFSILLADHDHANVRYNLAWSKVMLGEKAAALALLTDAAAAALPAAATLRVHLLHEAGEFDAAFDFGRAALARCPGDRALAAAMATLALDMEDLPLARACAETGGDHPEALAAAAQIALHDGDAQAARGLFDRALAIRDHQPRAWIGRGLAALIDHDAKSAAQDIDRGAQQFGDHIGSWIAAGWAHFVAGDPAAARQRFERALAIDPNFAESHGSLAVIALIRGDREDARRRTDLALRLDRQSFAGALAQALLAESPARARAIIDAAMTAPLNEGGLTIAGYMTGLARPTVH